MYQKLKIIKKKKKTNLYCEFCNHTPEDLDKNRPSNADKEVLMEIKIPKLETDISLKRMETPSYKHSFDFANKDNFSEPCKEKIDIPEHFTERPITPICDPQIVSEEAHFQFVDIQEIDDTSENLKEEMGNIQFFTVFLSTEK